MNCQLNITKHARLEENGKKLPRLARKLVRFSYMYYVGLIVLNVRPLI